MRYNRAETRIGVECDMKKLKYGSMTAFLLFAADLPADSADVAAIKSIRAESNRAIARHDSETVVASLDEDYVITISSGEILYGRAPQVESWARHFAEFPDVVYIRTPTQVTLSNAYPLAVENGSWEGSMTTPNGTLEKDGSYTAMWRKVDGVWKIRSELFVGLNCEGVDC